MICSKCDANIPDNATFCHICGSKVEQENDNKNNEIQNSENVSFNTKTNAEAVENKFQPSSVPEAFSTDGNADNSKKTPKKSVAIGIVAALLTISIIGAVFGVIFFKSSEKKGEKAPFLYKANGELFACKNINEKSEPFLISDDFYYSYSLSEDYKYIVYCENQQIDDDCVTYDLYLKELFDKKDQGTLLARGISSLSKVTGSIDAVYYQKNGDIYVVDNEGNSRKLFTDSFIFAFSDDNTKMLAVSYNNEDEYDETRTLSIIDLKTEEVDTISRNATSFKYNNSLSKICYQENGRLYVGGFNCEKQKISSELKDEYSSYYIKDDKIYFLEETDELGLDKFVADDCEKSDLEIKEPDWDDYSPDWSDYCPDYEDYETEVYDEFWDEYYTETDYDAYYEAEEKASDAYDIAVDKANEEYDKAEERYRAAKNRIELREELKDAFGKTEYALYCYDGEKTLVAEHVCYLNYINSNDDDSVNSIYIVTYRKPLKEISKIDIKKIESSEDVYEYLNKVIDYDFKTISDKKTNLLCEENKKEIVKILYYNKETKEYIVSKEKTKQKDNTYELYTVPVNSGFDKATLICDECVNCSVVNGKLGYYNDLNKKSGSATFNYDGTSIIDTCSTIMTEYDNKSCFYYSTDYNDKTFESTVWKYNNGKTEKIADDVYFNSLGFGIVDGKYVYITEYDTDDYCGDLICKDGDKSFKLDNNVSDLYNTNMETVYEIGDMLY